MKFGRIMIFVGLAATLGLVATGFQGYGGLADRAALGRHILLGLIALLLFVMAHSWVLIYLTGMHRLLRRVAGESGRVEALPPRLLAFRSRTLPVLLATIVGAIAVFLLGTEVFSGRLSGSVHGAVLWVTVVLQGLAMALEWRALAASERAFQLLRG